MCGIAGLLRVDGRPVEIARLEAASSLLEHRGPDDLGYLGWNAGSDARVGRASQVADGCSLGLIHRRLSILDLSDAGRQPMSSPDGRYHIVFNGEIYNYKELREELDVTGHRFSSTGDTEVLLQAYIRWGKAALERLVGMFAFAVLDTVHGKLFLARDFFGIKPLYYTRGGNGDFAFASEIKPLLELTGMPVRANPRRVYQYLRFGLTDHGDETMFDGIRQLRPAHFLEIDLDRPAELHPARYWDLPLDKRSRLTYGQAAERLRGMFLENVRLHLRADVPVGGALSGGIDSSAIVMGMRHLQGEDLDLHAVSYKADDPAISEAEWIDLIGREAGAEVHVTRPEPSELVNDLEELITAQEEPFGSTSIYAQHRVFRLARESGIKVMLDGQGADELLGGYRPYLASRMASLLRSGRWIEAGRFLSSIRRLPGLGMKDFAGWLGYVLLSPGFHRVARKLAGKELVTPWLPEKWFRKQGVDLHSPLPRARGRTALRETLYQTLTETSLPVLLRYEDRNSMKYSIESRVPFLTPGLAEFIMSLPEDYIIRPDGTTKGIFREAMRGIVPDQVLDRRDKIGFATPEQDWLTRSSDWVESVLGSETASAIPALEPGAVLEEWDAIKTGRHRFDWHLWRTINLVRWTERFGVSYPA